MAARAGAAAAETEEGLPDSIKRVGTYTSWPDERPGQNYMFNWCLNGDGVTPLRESSFRITKPLDLKIAGLQPPKKSPLQVRAGAMLLAFDGAHGTLLYRGSGGRKKGVARIVSPLAQACLSSILLFFASSNFVLLRRLLADQGSRRH
jgi:hypothetical protein